MSYINVRKRLAQVMSSQGDGTGVTDMGVDGKAITGATTAAPTVVTATSHGYVDNDYVFIDGATGTTEINGVRQIADDETSTFTLLDENGDAVGSAGTFGGTVDSNIALVYKPGATEVAHVTSVHATAADAAHVVDGLLGVTRVSSTGIVLALYGSSGLVKTLATIYGWSDFGLYGTVGGLGPVDTSLFDVVTGTAVIDFTGSVGKLDATDIIVNGNDKEFLIAYTDEDLAGLESLRFAVQGYVE